MGNMHRDIVAIYIGTYSERLCRSSLHVADKVTHTVGVTNLVIVPGDELNTKKGDRKVRHYPKTN